MPSRFKVTTTTTLKSTTTTTQPLSTSIIDTTRKLTTTTSPSIVRCEGVEYPSISACARAYCASGQRCSYTTETYASGVVKGRCVCAGATTTTQPQTTRCESISYATDSRCRTGLCPSGESCVYRPGVAATTMAAQTTGSCVCEEMQATTTTLQYRWCSDIYPSSAGNCLRGLCPPNTVCRLRSALTTSRLAAAASTDCVCVPCESDTTTTTVPTRCEAVEYATPNTCAGRCPPGQRCYYEAGTSTAAALTAASPGRCVCRPVTTTTQPSTNRCEAIQYPSSNTCVEGVCPPDYDCRYVQLASAANVGRCKCVLKSTTTTTQPGQVRCEGVLSASTAKCAEGLCPEDMKCRLILNPTAAGANACACVPAPTTTLQTNRCAAVEYPTAEACRTAVCPVNEKCRLVSYTLGSTKASDCVCVPATTTTLPSAVKCERVEYATSDSCEAAVCPRGQKCTIVTYTFGSTQVSGCVCLGYEEATSTTLPGQVKCEGVIPASAARCVEGLCPRDMKCRFTPSAASADSGSCVCVAPPTTTLAGQVKCEGISSATEDRCVVGMCPPRHKCKVVQSAAAADAASCMCVIEDSTPTTLPPSSCEAIASPSLEACSRGICPDGTICDYLVDDAGNARCGCTQGTAATVRTERGQQKGFVERVRDMLFGWV